MQPGQHGVTLHSPFETPDHLCVAQKLAKVYVKHVPSGAQHDVVIVAVTNAQDVGGNTASCTGVDEIL